MNVLTCPGCERLVCACLEIEALARSMCEGQHGVDAWDRKDRNYWRGRARTVFVNSGHAREVFAGDKRAPDVE